jgi:RNA-directed DNA polymerase
LSTKPFDIPKQLVWKAWQQVRANRGSGGVDGESIAEFERHLEDNLYRIWNLMSSGSYFPPDVRGVEIPKAKGGTRLLGIPTISDRVAQATVKLQIEERLEKVFLPDSYGYRPGKSAFDAVSITRSRCWEWKWCLEFDIRAMFDRIPHDLVMKAVKKHVPEKWCELLISRWLRAGIRLPSGERKERNTGTPQGGVISPLLCNLFMHYAFDLWMKRSFPELPWCRYADDGLVHCRSHAQAQHVRAVLSQRLRECGLELHEDKTHVVYTGKNPALRNAYATSFDFLGFTFRIRGTKSRLQKIVTDCFLPAVSDSALKKMKHVIKRVWRFRNRTDLSLEQIAEIMNPSVRGWFNYYGKFYKSRLQIIARYINTHLVKWARSHFRRQHSDRQKMFDWLRNEYCRRPRLMSHWEYFKVY